MVVKAEPEVPSNSTRLNRSNVLPLFLDEVLAGSPGSRGPVSADDGRTLGCGAQRCLTD